MRKQIRGIATSGGWVTVRGYCIGRSPVLFIHRDLDNGKRRVVTHLPTGHLIATFKTLARARKFATVLDGLAGDAMRSTRSADDIPAGFATAVRLAHAAAKVTDKIDA